MTTSLPDGLAGRVNRALDPLHSTVYFAPEQDEELQRVGLRPGRMCYFATRSAPMGPVPAAVVAATFYNFSPTLIERYIPRAWTLAPVDKIIEGRFAAVDRTLRRLLGDEAPHAPAVQEAADLARAATEGLPTEGRPLYAGHAALDWPDAPHLVLWHAISLLREFRGDGHIAVLLAAELSGVEALVTHTVTHRGFTLPAAKATRGWSDDEWDAAVERLRERGVVDEAGELTAAGQRLRADLEAATDRLAAAPWLTLGVERTQRLVELGKALSREAVGNGAFPPGVFAAPR